MWLDLDEGDSLEALSLADASTGLAKFGAVASRAGYATQGAYAEFRTRVADYANLVSEAVGRTRALRADKRTNPDGLRQEWQERHQAYRLSTQEAKALASEAADALRHALLADATPVPSQDSAALLMARQEVETALAARPHEDPAAVLAALAHERGGDVAAVLATPWARDVLMVRGGDEAAYAEVRLAAAMSSLTHGTDTQRAAAEALASFDLVREALTDVDVAASFARKRWEFGPVEDAA